MGICFCLAPGSFGWSPATTTPMIWGCTPRHLNHLRHTKGADMEEAENKARQAAGALAGEYLDHLKKTDLASLTPDEFDMLVRTVIETYRDEMAKACEPF